RAGAPRAGSITQTVIGLLVIVAFAVFGWDPVVSLFYTGGTLGSFGVLVLVTATSLGIVNFFRRDPGGEPAVRRLWAPLAASVALLVTLWLAVANFSTLLGVQDGDPLAWVLPSLYVVFAGLGLLWALGLRLSRPDVYRQIGAAR
ncbi:MAG: amino acid permease, partial [Nonomuraea sp.]|nr:amino acid permease [Nonomuraea sp.]